jgi:hypothetical protein
MSPSSTILRQLIKEEINRHTISENQIENLLGPDPQLHEDLIGGLQAVQSVAPMVVMLSLGGAVSTSYLKVALAKMMKKKDQDIKKYLRNAEDPNQAQGKLLHSLITAPAATAGKLAKKVYNTITGKAKKDKVIAPKLTPLVQKIQSHPNWDKLQALLKKYEADRSAPRKATRTGSSAKNMEDLKDEHKNFEEAMNLARDMLKQVIKDSPLDSDVEQWIKNTGDEWVEAVDDDVLKMMGDQLKAYKPEREESERSAEASRRAQLAQRRSSSAPATSRANSSSPKKVPQADKEKDYLF